MCCKIATKKIETYSLRQAGVERVASQRSATSDSGRDDVLVLRIQVHQSLNVTEVGGRMLVRRLEPAMVIVDDWVEERCEQGVGLRIRSIDPDSRVQVLNTWSKDQTSLSGQEVNKQSIHCLEFLSFAPLKSKHRQWNISPMTSVHI